MSAAAAATVEASASQSSSKLRSSLGEAHEVERRFKARWGMEFKLAGNVSAVS